MTVKTALAPQVLVVDDDASVRFSVRMTLEDAGYRVAEASNGEQALEWLRTFPERAVVVLDLQMPGLNGRQVMETVEQQEELAQRHSFLLLTANANTLPLSFVDLLTRLRTPVIAKPFDLDRLLEAVADAARRIA